MNYLSAVLELFTFLGQLLNYRQELAVIIKIKSYVRKMF